MSDAPTGVLPTEEPTTADPGTTSVELVIRAKPRDLGGFSVARSLPSVQRRLVGPFVFFDHMMAFSFGPGGGINVRPHPHIGLATCTYLFDGEILHKDSIGSEKAIRPGDVNWMIAGRGIVHSERTSAERRRDGGSLHGIQTWLAFSTADEEIAPAFEHHPARVVPVVDLPGVRLDVVAGHAYGARSPVGVRSPTLYVHARFEPGADLAVTGEHEERAAYVVDGGIACDGEVHGAGSMLVFRPGASVRLRADAAARVMLLGGAPLDGPRHLWWNFVSSSAERIERAKADWREGRFAPVPGDDVEFIPLPDK